MKILTTTISRAYALPFALVILLAAIAAWVDQFVPSSLRDLPTVVSAGNSGDTMMAMISIGLLAVGAHLIRIVSRVLTDRTTSQLEAKLLAQGAKTLMNNSFSWHINNHVGAVNVRLTRSSAAIAAVVKIATLEVMTPILVIFFTFRVCWSTSPVAACGIVILAVLIAAVTAWQIMSQRGVRVRINQGREDLGVRISDGLNGVEQVKLFASSEREIDGLRNVADSLACSEYRHHVAMASFDVAKAIIERGGSIAIIGFALLSVPTGTSTLVSAGVLIAVLVCVDRVLEPLRSLHRIVDELSEKMALSKDYLRLTEAASADVIQSDMGQIKEVGMIFFDNITYRYLSDSKPILNGASAAIPLGAKVAIIGKTGCGKSTVCRLLAGIVLPESGTIRIAGTEVIAIEKQVKRRVGVLTQDTWLTPQVSVLDNIRVARPDASDNDVLEAAKLAGVDHDLLFKDGLPRMVTARGAGFSGGQKQRIGLARVLLQKTDVVVLDEPMAAQDTVNREHFFAVVMAALADRTIFIITHDHSRLEFATHLMNLVDGRIIVDQNVEKNIVYANDSINDDSREREQAVMHPTQLQAFCSSPPALQLVTSCRT